MTSIAIFGGIGQEEACLGDAAFYDTLKKSYSAQVTHSGEDGASKKFSSAGNQGALRNRNEIVALVDLESEGDLVPSLISLKRGATEMEVI